MELSEKELHCVARLLQGAIFSESFANGCAFCKFQCKTEKDAAPHLDEIRIKLMDATGVDLGWDSSTAFWRDGFQYKRFLKNSNEEIQQKISKYFRCCEGLQVL